VWRTVTDLHNEKFSFTQLPLNSSSTRHVTIMIYHEHHTSQRQHIMSRYIFFNSEYNVLICKLHQYAVSSKYLAPHFFREHDLKLSIRQSIQAYMAHFTSTEGAALTYSNEKIIPVSYLKIIDGYQCQYDICNKILGTLNTMKDHCRV